MRKSVVIVGDSPLSFLVGRILDRDLARETHIEVIHLTRDDSLIYLPEITSLLGRHNFPSKSKLYHNVSCQKTTIKQINLIDRRVITTGGVVDYDSLFLDLTPSYISSEISKISQQASRLINEIKAKINTGRQLRARVTFAGENAMSWQMALALAADISAYPAAIQRAIIVQAQYPQISKLKDFLTENGVFSRKSVALLPGITINTPTAPVKNRLIRGALLDEKDNFILRDTLNPEGHPESIVVDCNRRLQQDILRVDQTLAVQVVSNMERFLAGDRQRTIKPPRSSGMLKGQTNHFVWIGNFQSNRLRAKLISSLDKKFYRQLIS
ncbi:MAG: hypothetical protein NUV80_04110 [Candidatus Berkelbacteria bacterium]|nr:hypothetical protein [Candidatus Berkelbacteria bacterium]MCR4307723.1 hypothetical protein [Candidatus Berkelbacteria bacterium]